ncbi:hypothetical protein PR002_g2163 [Phytophthora rubi]|uniref:DASH complex subunit DAD4 n=1 Tax=Phytophthora rubi TaxID=129364 RepID=A0A6A3NJ53_9STRA|nr:hypothetical protein PR002_g2163 [Phytophthora rubi]
MQNPHEEKQKALLQRITGSVARLHEVLKEINTQIEKSDSFREELTVTCQVWKGYESRLLLRVALDDFVSGLNVPSVHFDRVFVEMLLTNVVTAS